MAMNNAGQSPIVQKPPGYRGPSASPSSKPVPRKSPARLSLSMQKKGKRRSCCRVCCCCCCITLLIVIVLLAILGGGLYFWLTPKAPVFQLQSFNITTFDVTRKADGSYLNALTSLRIEAKNPNGKLKFRYGDSDVRVTAEEGGDDETDLGSTSIPAFAQGKKSITILRIQTQVKDLPVDDGAGKRIMDRFNAGSLTVSVEVKTSFGVGVGGIKTGMLGVTVNCRGTVSGMLDGGGKPKCTIHTLKWINIH